MDHHHHRHNHRHNHHQPQRHHQPHNNPSEFIDSRYYHHSLPPPPPSPSPYPDNPNFYPPPPPPPPRHLPPPPLPPPPQQPPPPSHSFYHPPPPPPPQQPHPYHHHQQQHRHFDDVNFVNSSPRHHRRHLPVDDDPDPYRRHSLDFGPNSPPRVFDHHHHHRRDDDQRRRFHLPEQPPRVPPPVAPIDARPDSGLDWDHHHRPVSLDRFSPTPFIEPIDDRFRRDSRDFESPSRFRDDLNIDQDFRLRQDELWHRRDDRRIVSSSNLERDDHRHHEEYRPEMLLGEFEPVMQDCVRGPEIDDELLYEEDLNLRRGGPSREVSRSPIKFRNRGIDLEERLREYYEEGGSSSGRYSERGGRREELQEYNNRTTPRKKSAFLRIQEPVRHNTSGSFRNNNNKFINASSSSSSPHKSKESLEFLDRRVASEERHGSPVELDVSFKSNALIAKAITTGPSSSSDLGPKDNSADTRVDGKSPVKEDSCKNSGGSKPFVSRKDEKGSENRIRKSPVMKRMGLKASVEVHGSNSESSSSGSSSLSGGSSSRGSPKGEVLDKDDTKAGSDKVSLPNVRTKRKSVISLSRLSSSVSKDTDGKVVNRDSSATPSSKSCMSDKRIKQSVDESSSCGQVVGPTESKVIVDTRKLNVNVASDTNAGSDKVSSPDVSASDKNTGSDKVSSPNLRKRRKAIISRSRLSSSVPTKTDAEVVNVDSSANPSSEKCMSDKCVKQSGEGLSSGGHKVIGPMQSEVVVDTEKLDVNASSVGVEGETMGQSVSEASLPKELSKISSLENLHDSQEARAPDNPGNDKGSFQEVKEASNSDDESEFVEICELDSDVECRSTKDQAMVTLLVSSGSGEGSSEPMTCMGGNVDNTNNHCGNVGSHNSIDINSSIWSPVYDSNMTPDEGDLTCAVVNIDKPCDTQFNMLNERSVVGPPCVDSHLNRDSNQAELRNSVDSGNLDKSANNDVYSIKTSNVLSCDHAPVDREKPSTTSDTRSKSDSEEQQTAGTTSVNNEAREESPQACISKFGHSCAKLRDFVDSANLEKFSIIDLHSFKTSTAFSNDVSVDAEKVTTASDIRTTNGSEEQQCQGAITKLVDNEGKEGSLQACIGMVSNSTIVSENEDISPPSRKRKVESKLYSLDSGISEAFQDTTLTRSFPIMDLNLPIVDLNLPTEKLGSEVSGSPLHGSELMEACLDGSISLNLGSYLDPANRFSSCSKKQKILSLESVSSEALVSVNSDIPACVDALNLLKYSTESAEGIGLSSSVLPVKDVDAATNTVLTTTNFADSSNAELCLRGPCLSPKDSTLSCEKQPCDLSESKCKQKENVDSMMAEASDGSESIPLESNAGMAANDQNGGVHCLRDDHSGVSENEFLVTDMECESNTAANGNSPSVSDCTQQCAEYGVAGYSDLQEPPSNVGSSGADSLLTTTLYISDTVPAPSVMSEEKLGMDDKSSNDQVASSKSSPLLESNRKNWKPPISASAVDKPFTQKTALIPLKNAKSTVSNSNATSRQLIRRNVLIRGDTSFPSSRVSSVTSYPNKAASTFPAKPRTWRRTDSAPAANAPVKKASVVTALPQRPPIDKTVKFQGTSRTSYIRKGNSLVRNPASAAATLAPRSFGASINQSKPNDTNIIKNMGSPGTIDSTVVSDTVTEVPSAPIEMPRTPPLPSTGNTSSCDIVATGDCRSSPLVGQSEGLGNGEAVKSSETSLNSSGIPETVDRHLEDTGTLSDGCLPLSNAKRIVYIKRKSNQLIAASNSSEPSMHNVDRAPALSSDNNYYKRRKNQLIRASSESNIQQMVSVMDDSSNSQPQRPLNVHSGRSSTKRQVNKVKPQKVSLVWKLGDTKSFGKGVDMLRCGKILSHLLPWKRATYRRSVWKNTVNVSNSSPMKTRKLLSSRKRATLYVRSGRGYSLRRSKVISLGGSSLKWSKSMERRSKKVNEEATAAAAAAAAVAMGSVERQKTGTSGVISTTEGRSHVSQKPVPSLKLHPGERIFRIGVFRYRMDPSRRSLQRIPDEELSNSSASKPVHDARKTYVPKRLLIGSDEYIRIGNGNQLVRDPKRRTRMLASEKVRWSLHTARMRLAKKRKFCQFFTRFGECKKGEGKCPFIHDPSKIAVCTKFLNGLCGDPNCKLTHKVIPERMPDCSFFLQGLCSNENCPYRHVNVNPKASICESFLRGYCAEGNECRKKHTYICPEFEATGSCAQGAKCKLYHPKKGKGGKKRRLSKDQRNARGRYFGSELKMVAEPEIATVEKQDAPKDEPLSFQGELGDFISLDASDDETEEKSDPNNDPTTLTEGDALSSQFDDLEELIKPLRLFNRTLGSNVQALTDLPPLNGHHFGEHTVVQGR